MIKDFCKTIKKFKNKKWSVQFFVDILQLPHTVISNSEKLTHPNVHVGYIMNMWGIHYTVGWSVEIFF